MKMEKLAAALLGIGLFAASSGMTNAYMKANPEVLENMVTPVLVDVGLIEPLWNPENGQGLLPGSTVPKNPTAVNTGTSDAWMFLRISVPVKHIALVNTQSRRKEEAADVPLFSFTASKDWELIEQTPAKGRVDYVYGYRKILKPQEKTTPLFEEVRLVNYLEGELTADEVLEIPAEALAIQKHAGNEDAGLAEIYRVYLAEEIGTLNKNE